MGASRKKHSLRQRVYHTIEETGPVGSASWLFDAALITIILLNASVIILETLPGMFAEHRHVFRTIELLSAAFFGLEYCFRLWCIVENPRFRGAAGRLRFMATPLAIIDFLAIIPFFTFFFAHDADIVKVLSLFRIFRFVKVVRYMQAVTIFMNVLRAKRQELSFTFLFMLFTLILVSSVMYYVENPAQPEKFSSIPATMWWGVETLTTLGYGDMVPMTPVGKVLGGLIAIAGVGIVAIPTGILAAGFTEELRRRRHHVHEPDHCPHCGKKLHVDP